MMPPFVVLPTNRIAHFVEVSLYLFYLAQRVKLKSIIEVKKYVCKGGFGKKKEQKKINRKNFKNLKTFSKLTLSI